MSEQDASVEVAREEQLSYWILEAQKYADAYRTGWKKLDDWRYVPPADDDWHRWRGATKLWALERRYRYAYMREAALQTGHGPYYCPACEQRPGNGWRAEACLECAWDTYLAEETLQVTRACGRDFIRAGWVEKLGLAKARAA